MLSQGTVKFQCSLTIEGECKPIQNDLVQDVINAIDQVSGDCEVKIDIKTKGGEGD